MSGELKACPNPECKGGRIDLRTEKHNAETVVSWCQCLDCGVRGPAAVRLSDRTSGPVVVDNKRIAADRWNAMPRVTGPGEATRSILATLAAKQAEAVKTTEEYTLYVWPSPWGGREITYETVTAALSENGMEAGS